MLCMGSQRISTWIVREMICTFKQNIKSIADTFYILTTDTYTMRKMSQQFSHHNMKTISNKVGKEAKVYKEHEERDHERHWEDGRPFMLMDW